MQAEEVTANFHVRLADYIPSACVRVRDQVIRTLHKVNSKLESPVEVLYSNYLKALVSSLIPASYRASRMVSIH